MTHKFGWYNVEIGHPVDKHVYMIIKRFENNKLEWLGLTEVREYLSVLELEAPKHGLKVVTREVSGEPQSLNQAFLVREDVVVGKVWSIEAGVDYYAPGGALRRAQRPLCAELDGRLVVMVHMPVQAWRNANGKLSLSGAAKRVLAYKRAIDRLVKVFENNMDKEVWAVGDWNCTPDVVGPWSPNNLRRRVGGAWVKSGKDTHGAKEIDFGIRRAAAGKKLEKVECVVLADPLGMAHSDHKMVKAVVGVHSTPTPPVSGEKPIKDKFTGPTVDGVDLSHYQAGKIDWAKAKADGVKFVYYKVTEGLGADWAKEYSARRAECKKAGIPFGAYHFARASRVAGNGTAQAKKFLAEAKPVAGDMRPMLDLETTEGLSMTQLIVWAGEFMAEVKRQTGVWPILYTPYDLGKKDAGTLIWRARYNNSNMQPVGHWDIWQFSNGELGRPNYVDGIGHCDIDTVRAGLTLSEMRIPK